MTARLRWVRPRRRGPLDRDRAVRRGRPAARRARRGARAPAPAAWPSARGLEVHHVPVELRRPSHRLAGVVDDEVEPGPGDVEVVAERLHARRVAQVEAEDLEPVGPVVEVGLLRVAQGGVAREPGRDDQLRAGAEELDAGLVADLHPAAGQEGHPAAEVGRLGPLVEVQRAAVRAQLVVEVVDLDVVLLADVAVLRVAQSAGPRPRRPRPAARTPRARRRSAS